MDRRPLAVQVIAIYQIGFSAFLLGLIVWQIATHHIHATWQEKIIVLPFTFIIAILPGVLGFGLWMLDSAARLGVIFFSLLHAISEIAYLGHAHIPSPAFTILRIVWDGIIILWLCHSSVRKAFRWQPLNLSLRNT